MALAKPQMQADTAPTAKLFTGLKVDEVHEKVVMLDGIEIARIDCDTHAVIICGALKRRAGIALLHALLVHNVCNGTLNDDLHISDVLYHLDMSLAHGRSVEEHSPF